MRTKVGLAVALVAAVGLSGCSESPHDDDARQSGIECGLDIDPDTGKTLRRDGKFIITQFRSTDDQYVLHHGHVTDWPSNRVYCPGDEHPDLPFKTLNGETGHWDSDRSACRTYYADLPIGEYMDLDKMCADG